MQPILAVHRLLVALVVAFGLTAASGAHALPLQWASGYDDDILATHDFQFVGEFASLPRVTVYPRRDWVTVCSGSSCADYFQQMMDTALTLALLRQSLLSPEQIAAITAFSGCSPVPNITAQTRNTTSHDDNVVREVAATNIIDSVLGQRSLSLNNNIVTVMYSDGGTEKFKYITMASKHSVVVGSLVKGTGIAGSACSGSS